jgi:dGTPase
MRHHGGFEHNRQGLRVVELLEKRYPDFPGLNLTFELREGILKHETIYDNPFSSESFSRPKNHLWNARLSILPMKSLILATMSTMA